MLQEQDNTSESLPNIGPTWIGHPRATTQGSLPESNWNIYYILEYNIVQLPTK